jgi:hypothetical protein
VAAALLPPGMCVHNNQQVLPDAQCYSSRAQGSLLTSVQDVQVVLEQQCNTLPCLPWLMPRAQAAGSSTNFGLADKHGVLQQSCHIKQQQTAAEPISATWQQGRLQGWLDLTTCRSLWLELCSTIVQQLFLKTAASSGSYVFEALYRYTKLLTFPCYCRWWCYMAVFNRHLVSNSCSGLQQPYLDRHQ